jgi:nucleotidyltransferase AbiEii toxin of type IV toxin-antitoxin system
MNDGFEKFIAAPERDRLDIFLAASRRLGAAVQNVEKDFWVCRTLDVLYHGIPPGSPRLLFKGGTSRSKAHDLMRRFSEDIDITVFREDLKQAASIEDMEKLSGKKRKAKLDAIRDACRAWVARSLRETLAAHIKGFVSSGGRIELVFRNARVRSHQGVAQANKSSKTARLPFAGRCVRDRIIDSG